MPTNLQPNLKSQFTTYLQANFDYDFVKVQEHSELTANDSSRQYLAKSTRRSDYVIDRVYDLINDYTDADFDDVSTLVGLDFERLLDKDYEYGDGAIDIYWSNLFATANLFSDEIDEAIGNFDKFESLAATIQMAQFCFYSSFYRWSIESLQAFVAEIELNLFLDHNLERRFILV